MEWKFYHSGEAGWEAMLIKCREAKDAIDFEHYIFTDVEKGKIGCEFVELFKAKAREGVRVRILTDFFGSHGLFFSGEVRKLRATGVEVSFNILSLYHIGNILSLLARDHRKLVIVDGECAFIGSGIIEERARKWRDTYVELCGPIVAPLQSTFEDAWRGVKSGEKIHVTTPKESDDGFVVLPSGPKQNHILEYMLKGIERAERTILICSPYFVAPTRFLKAVTSARARGVEISVLVPEKKSEQAIQLLTEASYDVLLNAGVRIFRRSPYMHAKYMIVDDEWVTFGSANIDRLSLRLNYELNIASRNKDFIADLKKQFLIDLENAVEVLKTEWAKRSLWQKALEKMSVVLHRVA